MLWLLLFMGRRRRTMYHCVGRTRIVVIIHTTGTILNFRRDCDTLLQTAFQFPLGTDTAAVDTTCTAGTACV